MIYLANQLSEINNPELIKSVRLSLPSMKLVSNHYVLYFFAKILKDDYVDNYIPSEATQMRSLPFPLTQSTTTDQLISWFIVGIVTVT